MNFDYLAERVQFGETCLSKKDYAAATCYEKNIR